MSFIGDYCVDSISIYPKGTPGGDGTYPYNVAVVNTTARVQRKRGTLMRPPGVMYEFTHVIWIRPTETVALEDRIVYSGQNYTIFGIEERDFLDGTDSHKRLYVG